MIIGSLIITRLPTQDWEENLDKYRMPDEPVDSGDGTLGDGGDGGAPGDGEGADNENGSGDDNAPSVEGRDSSQEGNGNRSVRGVTKKGNLLPTGTGNDSQAIATLVATAIAGMTGAVMALRKIIR